MTKYVIKKTTTATETNINFKGETRIYYTGKRGIFIDRIEILTYWAREYGFSTKAAAAKALKHYSENVNWFNNTFKTWTSIFEIIEVEV